MLLAGFYWFELDYLGFANVLLWFKGLFLLFHSLKGNL